MAEAEPNTPPWQAERLRESSRIIAHMTENMQNVGLMITDYVEAVALTADDDHEVLQAAIELQRHAAQARRIASLMAVRLDNLIDAQKLRANAITTERAVKKAHDAKDFN